MPEREIIARGQVLRAEAEVQYLHHEILCRHQAEFVIERDFVQDRYARRSQGVGSLRG